MPHSSNPSPDTLDAIRDLNLSYLMTAQSLLRENFGMGMFRLGLDKDCARVLLTLSPAQVLQIASAGGLLCTFRLNDAVQLRALHLDEQEPTAAGPVQSLHHLRHVAILLARQAATEEPRQT